MAEAPPPLSLIPLAPLQPGGADAGEDPLALSVLPSGLGRAASILTGHGDGRLRRLDPPRDPPRDPPAPSPPASPALAWTSAPAHRGWITDLAVAPGVRLAVSAGRDGALALYDLKDGRSLGLRQAHTASVFALAVSPDGTRFASAGEDGHLILWTPGRAAPHRILPFAKAGPLRAGEDAALASGPPAGLYSLAWSPDGATLAVGDFEGYITLVEAWTGRLLWRVMGTGDIPWRLAFSPDGGALALGSGAGALLLDARSGAPRDLLPGALSHGASTPAVLWLRGPQARRVGAALATAGEDGHLRIWSAEGAPLASAPFPEAQVWRVAQDPAAGILYTTHPGGILRPWRLG